MEIVESVGLIDTMTSSTSALGFELHMRADYSVLGRGWPEAEVRNYASKEDGPLNTSANIVC